MKGKQSSVLLLFATLFCAACSNHVQSTIDAPEDQAYFTHGSIKNISSDENYYYTAVNGLIEAASKDSLEFHVICNKPDCFHKDSSCTAFTDSGGVWAYDGQIFALRKSWNGAENTLDYDLVRTSPENGISTKIASILRYKNKAGAMYPPDEFMIHKGYAYYVVTSGADSGEVMSMVYCLKLEENSNPEEIYKVTGQWGASNKLIGKGEKIYILSLCASDQYSGSVSASLQEYSVSDGTLNQIKYVKGMNANYFYIHDGSFIYQTASEHDIHCMSLETGEDQLLISSQCDLSGGLCANNTYIFDWRYTRIGDSEELVGVGEPYAVWVYTYEGENVAKIELPVQNEVFAGSPLGADDRYLFFYQKEFADDRETGNTLTVDHIWTYDMANMEDGQWEDHIID